MNLEQKATVGAGRRGWPVKPLWSLIRRTDVTDRQDSELLSVYRDHGVVPKASRDDNFNKPSEDLSSYRYVRPGDLVLNKMKTWQGSLAVSAYEGIVSPAYYVCALSPIVEPRYLHYLLRSQPYIALYGSLSKGIRPNQWDLPFDEFKSIPVALPEVDEQRRIADFLDDQVARINQAIEHGSDQMGTVESRLAVAVDRLLPPKTATAVPLSHVARIVDTEHKTAPTDPDGTYASAGTSAVRSGRLLHHELRPISQATYREWTVRGRPRVGDVLLTREAPVGQVALVGESDPVVAIGQRVVLLQPRSDVLVGGFLAAFLQSSRFFGTVDLLTQGSLHPHLNMSDIGRLRVPTADFEAQAVVAARRERALDDQAALLRSLKARQVLLEERKRSLITAAVTGELDVSSASVRAADAVVGG